jgi:hypothetical protein
VSTRFVGQVIPGGSLSKTVTVKVHGLEFPLPSVAILVTTVVPTGNVLPLGGRLTTFVTLQLSVAPTVQDTLFRLQRPRSVLNVKFVGHTIAGGV